jgi:hypothetical protein
MSLHPTFRYKRRRESYPKGEPTMHLKLGLSIPAIILLAAIAAIRVPLHDLGIVSQRHP